MLVFKDGRKAAYLYTLIYLFSFCFFTGVFHAVASAQTSKINADDGLSEATSNNKNPHNLKKEDSPTATDDDYLGINTYSDYLGLDPKNPNIEAEAATPTQILISSSVLTSTNTPTKIPPTASPTVILPTATAMPTPTIFIPTVTPTLTPTIIIPTDTPVPSPTSEPAKESVEEAPVTDLETLFTQYGNEYSVDKNLLKKIAQCESGFNVGSVGGGGRYVGMYQFAESTWVSNRQLMGFDSNPDLRMNAGESIRTAAFMISRGGLGAWPNCN
jgi:Transglycosylase-like domain